MGIIARLTVDAAQIQQAHRGEHFQRQPLFCGGVAQIVLSRQGLDMLETVDSGQGYIELARVAAWPLGETGAAARRAG